jgi:hypothetical protein
VPAARLTTAEIADHLAGEPVEVRAIVMKLRRVILAAAPNAAEAIRFNSLCYYRADVPFGSIGGNICMIEVRTGEVVLSFIHGADLPDPEHLLRGRGKAKRFVNIASAAHAKDPRIRSLISAAAAKRKPRASAPRRSMTHSRAGETPLREGEARKEL